MGNEVAILGVGMHPWGKWGRNFVEYGIHACQAALKDAGLEWTDVDFSFRRRHGSQRLPGLRGRRDLRQALGWSGARWRAPTPPARPVRPA